MRFNNLNLALERNINATEQALSEFFKSKKCGGDMAVLMQSEKYSLLGAGKRIRPFLVNTVCKVLGGDESASMPLAIAVEMIHTYSLIHDDLPCMDNDDMRRGKPSNHVKYGEACALLAGDALLTNAFFSASCAKIAPEKAAQAIAAISEAAGDEGMIGGQIIDLEGENKRLTFDELLLLHSLKTGKMIELSAFLGCLAAGYSSEDKKTQNICSYARKIGLAFQVVDDILDVTGNAETVGKNVRSDEQNRKTTFLTFFSVDDAKKYARSLTIDAVNDIMMIDNSRILADLAEYLLERDR